MWRSLVARLLLQPILLGWTSPHYHCVEPSPIVLWPWMPTLQHCAYGPGLKVCVPVGSALPPPVGAAEPAWWIGASHSAALVNGPAAVTVPAGAIPGAAPPGELAPLLVDAGQFPDADGAQTGVDAGFGSGGTNLLSPDCPHFGGES